MKQVMGLVAHRFSQELIIQFQDVGILVRFPDDLPGILTIDGHLPLLNDIGISVVIWLSAPSDATTRTRHNLDGVEGAVTVPDLFQQFPGIAQSVGNPDVDRNSVEINGCLSETIHSPELFKVDLRQFLAGKDFIGRSDSRFNDASGGSKDDAGSG